MQRGTSRGDRAEHRKGLVAHPGRGRSDTRGAEVPPAPALPLARSVGLRCAVHGEAAGLWAVGVGGLGVSGDGRGRGRLAGQLRLGGEGGGPSTGGGAALAWGETRFGDPALRVGCTRSGGGLSPQRGGAGKGGEVEGCGGGPAPEWGEGEVVWS